MTKTPHEWLLIFYALPSKPVGNRIKIWRKMAKAGAVQLKGAVYILPATDEHYEFFQWLISEVSSMGGDGAFVKVHSIETMPDKEIIALFNKAREQDLRLLEKKVDPLERRIQSIKKGTGVRTVKGLADQVHRIVKEYDELRKTDFFSTKAGGALGKRAHALEAEVRKLTGPVRAVQPAPLSIHPREQFQGKVWVTRKNPFVDRMASAWLIRRFIDSHARFRFIDENDLESLREETIVSFDIRGGAFTHQSDLCTFEVLAKSFSIRDHAVKSLAELVHDLDIRDNKYGSPEAAGIEEILTGIRKDAATDADALERGIAVFELLYRAKS